MSKNKQAVQKTLNKIFKPSTVKIISLSIALISLTLLIALTQRAQDVRRKAQIVEDQVFLNDTFDTGISDSWTEFLNHYKLNDQQWYWENGVVKFDPARGGQNADDALIMYTDPSDNPYYWRNYTLEVDARGSHMGVWFRGKYEDSALWGQWTTGYFFVLTNREARLWKIQTPENCVTDCDNPQYLYHFGNPTKIASKPFSNNGSTTFHIKLTVNEGNIRAWVGNSLIFDHNDSDFQYGTIGLFSYQELATFDNVVVTGTPVIDATPPICKSQVPGVLRAFEGARIYLKGSLSQDSESGISSGSWIVKDDNGQTVKTIDSVDGYLTGLAVGNYTAELTVVNGQGLTGVCNQDLQVYSPVLPGSVSVSEVSDYSIPSYTGQLHADNNPRRAIIVSWPGKNYRFVFWHEASYVPFWEFPNGTGANYQFFEGAYGSGELFNVFGRKDENSNVEVIRNDEDMVVVKWWYYDVNKDTGIRVGYAEEYYYFFPNGLVLREMELKWGRSFEPMEIMIINPRATHWWENIEFEPGIGKYHMSSAIDIYSGENRDYWAVPTGDINNASDSVTGASSLEIEDSAGVLLRTYLKDYDDPFVLYGDNSFVTNGDIKELGSWGYPHFVHWPIGWLNSEWREASESELRTYPTHTSILGTDLSGKGPYYWLIGVSSKSNQTLVGLGKEWLSNPIQIPDYNTIPTQIPTETPPVTPYPNSCSGITYYVNPSPEPNTTVTVNINRSGANSCFGNWNNVGLLLDGVPMGVNICYADGLNCNAGYHAYVNSGSSGTHLLQFSVNNNSCWCNSTTFTTQSLITNTPTPSITPTSIPTHTITPTPPPVPGDANGDGHVTIADYIIWLNHYGMTTGNGPQDGDFDGSGSVGIADYIIWLNNYGT